LELDLDLDFYISGESEWHTTASEWHVAPILPLASRRTAGKTGPFEPRLSI